MLTVIGFSSYAPKREPHIGRQLQKLAAEFGPKETIAAISGDKVAFVLMLADEMPVQIPENPSAIQRTTDDPLRRLGSTD
jgi:hypothetical protein